MLGRPLVKKIHFSLLWSVKLFERPPLKGGPDLTGIPGNHCTFAQFEAFSCFSVMSEGQKVTPNDHTANVCFYPYLFLKTNY